MIRVIQRLSSLRSRSPIGVVQLWFVTRPHRMNIKSDIVERVTGAASQVQIPISDTKQE